MTRIEFLLNEFVKTEILTDELLFEFICADPTTKHVEKDEDNKVMVDKIKVGKYSQWIIKNYLDIPKVDYVTKRPLDKETIEESQRVFLEDLYKVKDDLTKYERFKGRLPIEQRDINNLTLHYADDREMDDEVLSKIHILYECVKDFSLAEATTTKSERTGTMYHPGANVFHEDEKWLVMEISENNDLGKEAAVFYGGYNQETRWCTSAPGLNYFNGYVKDSPLYVFLDKTDTNLGSKTGLPLHRYQIHFSSGQFMDVNDRSFDFVDFLINKCSPELKEMFRPHYYGVLSKKDSVKISRNEKTINNISKLYGLDGFFKHISPEVTDLYIMDLDQQMKQSLVINEDLYTLKNLRNIIIVDNAIDEINIDFTKFENLYYLCLKNNENLKDLGCDYRKFKNIGTLDLTNTKIPVIEKLEVIEITPNNYDFELLREMHLNGENLNVTID